jgi:hypothetical protein
VDTRGGQDLSSADWAPLHDHTGAVVRDRFGNPVKVRFGGGKAIQAPPAKSTSPVERVREKIGEKPAFKMDAASQPEVVPFNPPSMIGTPLQDTSGRSVKDRGGQAVGTREQMPNIDAGEVTVYGTGTPDNPNISEGQMDIRAEEARKNVEKVLNDPKTLLQLLKRVIQHFEGAR